jgi:hypothetical protein
LTLFSERKGLKKVRTEVQIDSIDEALRNRLWNSLTRHYWSRGKNLFPIPFMTDITDEMLKFLMNLWDNYFKKSVDSLSGRWDSDIRKVKKYYYTCQWFEVYDFLEFVANNYPDNGENSRFMRDCDIILEKELSAYRFVGGKITQITSEEEISEIEEALQTPLKPVRAHLEKSLELLSDKKSPDYRNSIKESISAVEAICRIIANNDKATLGKALDMIEKKDEIELHGALKRAFDSLYGYTSSAEGIRHALLDENISLNFEDAKFMLVSCSAFVNYLIAKTSRAGMKVG